MEAKKSPPFYLRARRLWLSLGWMLILLVVFLSLASNPIEVLPVAAGDKLGHVLAYGVLMVWFANLYETSAKRRMFAIGFVAMGIALEFVQGWSGYRAFELADMVADAIGVAAGWVFAPPRIPNVLRSIEKTVLHTL